LVRAEFNPDREIDLYAALETLRDQVGETATKDDLTKPRQSSTLLASDMLDVVAAISALPNNDLTWEAWNPHRNGTVGQATGGSPAGLATWHAFSERSQNTMRRPLTNDGFTTRSATRSNWGRFDLSHGPT